MFRVTSQAIDLQEMVDYVIDPEGRRDCDVYRHDTQ